MKTLLVLAGAVVLGCIAAPAAFAAGPYGFTSGAATVHHHFAWSAHEGPNGVTGQMTVQFRNGEKVHANVTCIEFAGTLVGFPPMTPADAASIFGTVYKSDNALSPKGAMIEFEVADASSSGENDEFRLNPSPPDSPDPRGADCKYDPGQFPIQQGNVQVEPATP